MNTKLRLLVTEKCPRNCPKCCNKQYDILMLPVVGDLSKYTEISITGGEPLLFEQQLKELASSIKMLYPRIKLYLYTSYPPSFSVAHLFDGVTYTLHEDDQLYDFMDFQRYMRMLDSLFSRISMRLKVFEGVHFDMSRVPKGWKSLKRTYWLDNCPIPEGEDFMRLPELWR